MAKANGKKAAVAFANNTTYQLESDVEIPLRTRQSKYPFAAMLPGQSFLAEGKKPASLGQLASKYGKRLDKKFKVREVENGTRVWCIE